MTEHTPYTIGELAARAGVTPRTVRYYAAEGLLPPPDTRGRYATYGDHHLRYLQLIAKLKAAYLPLNAIKQRLAQLTPEKIEQALSDQQTTGMQPDPPQSAAEYLALLLAEPLSPATAAPMPHSMPASHQALLREDADVYAAETPTLPPALAATRAAEHVPPQLKRMSNVQKTVPSTAPSSTNETWRRHVLTDGVELHVREPLPAELHDQIQKLLVDAAELFQRDG